jgi:hypothetical protein
MSIALEGEKLVSLIALVHGVFAREDENHIRIDL